jgi:short-subunit dehydrogenase
VTDLGNAVVVVTGASSGIGRATAVACAERGARLVLAARPSPALYDAARDCQAAGGAAHPVPTDVVDQAAVERLADDAVARFGRIDVWVQNAAVMAYGRFEDTPAEVHRRVIETNLFGPIHAARAVLPVFRRQGTGTLINVASLYGKMTSPYVSGYVTSKYGLIGFSEVLRQELQDAPDINVCTVLPGSVDTPIFRHAANYVGRQPRPVPLVSSPERVVRVILRLTQRPRREVAVGWSARFLALGHTVLPGLYNRLAPLAMRLLGLGAESTGIGSGNVFAPQADWDRVNGGWRRQQPHIAGAAAVAAASLAAYPLWTALGRVLTDPRRRCRRAAARGSPCGPVRATPRRTLPRRVPRRLGDRC